jgi:hypothetical protein
MRHRLMAALLLLAPTALAQDGAPDQDAVDAAQQLWMVHTARMEGASVNVEEAAADLQRTAAQIAEGGRLTALSALAADAAKLERRVVSAKLAAQVLTDVK